MEEDLRKFNRLLRLLQYLSNPAGMTVKRMAELTGVDNRTIYRDINELRDACFDIVQLRSKGPYRLSGEYATLGQTLSVEEVLCLGLASCLLRDQLGNIGRDAMRKLQGFIKGEKRHLAADVSKTVEVQGHEEHRWMPQLLLAVNQRRSIRFDYSRGEEPTRNLDPYTVFYQDQRWYVQGFDHLRQDLRRFRLARMESLIVLPQTFQVPAAYDSKSALFHKWDIAQSPPVSVVCEVEPELAQWLAENPVHPTQVLEGRSFSLQVRNPEALAHWLLSLRGIRVLAPEQLRIWVRDKAQTLVNSHM